MLRKKKSIDKVYFLHTDKHEKNNRTERITKVVGFIIIFSNQIYSVYSSNLICGGEQKLRIQKVTGHKLF